MKRTVFPACKVGFKGLQTEMDQKVVEICHIFQIDNVAPVGTEKTALIKKLFTALYIVDRFIHCRNSMDTDLSILSLYTDDIGGRDRKNTLSGFDRDPGI